MYYATSSKTRDYNVAAELELVTHGARVSRAKPLNTSSLVERNIKVNTKRGHEDSVSSG